MLAPGSETGHTATMSVKTAAFLALVGMVVLTVLVAADFINTALAVSRGLIPAMAFLRSLIYLFASITVTVFFFVFFKKSA
jgi:hypothetical protein